MKRARLTTRLLSGTFLSTAASRLALTALLATSALLATLPAHAASITVSNEAQLRSAINNAQNGDTINFAANVTLTSNLPQVQRNVIINGGNFTLSGNNQYRGLFVQSGTVAINNLTIANAIAQGGNGGNGFISGSSSSTGSGGGGGGGAGLGGALFVASGANVTVNNVSLRDNQAHGGNGSGVLTGGAFQTRTSGGGGGLFGNGGDGGTFQDGNGGPGNGGQGGGGAGGFGGGGGGTAASVAGAGGFGGGGGGTGTAQGTPGAGGFGGGVGGRATGGGGGGMGGAIFVQQGGALNLAGPLNVSGGSVAGGSSNSGGQNGRAFGSGIFLQGNGSFSATPGAGQTQTISDAIADQTGVSGSGGSWSLVKNGAGTTILTGTNAYSGGTVVSAGVLQGNTAGLQGNITNNASVVFDQTGTGTYAGSMSGTGTLTKTGTGDVTLTGTNTYSGGTTVSGGALLFSSDANLGAAGVGIKLNNGGTIGAVRDVVASSNRPLTITNSGGLRSENFSTGNSTLTWSGVISGNGTLVKSGSGDVILSGANTYLGGTTVTGGVLRINSDTNLGAPGTGITLSNNGAIGSTKDTPAATSFGRNITLDGSGGIAVALHPITWSGNVGGTGPLVIRGPGELELTGTNTYSGGTTLLGGTLRVASDDKLGAAGTKIEFLGGALRASETFTSARPIDIPFSGAFLVDAGKALTLSGVVSGKGALTKVGEGTLILTGANTYTGDIFENGGILQGNTTSLRNNILFDTNANNPIARSVTFNQATDGTFAGNITGLGSLTKSGAGTLILSGTNNYSQGTTVLAGSLQGTSTSLQGSILNNAAVIFDQGTNGTYAGVMSGTGTLTKNGTGKLSIPGVQAFIGATNINAGNLNVNGSLESSSVVNVNKGGTLSGNGKFGNVVDNGGTISPGNSIGTLHINGNLTMGSGSKYHAEINGEASDRIEVSGTANIQSSIFEIAHDTNTASPPVLPGKTYTLITAKGGLTVTSPQVGIADFPFISFTLSADTFNGYLTTSRSLERFADLAATPNEKAVANALDTAGAANPVWQQVVGATETQARAAFANLSNASIHANAAGVMSEQSLYLRDAVIGRLRQDFVYGTSLAPAINVLSYVPEAPRSAPAAAMAIPFVKAPPASAVPLPVYAVWVQGLGSRGSLGSDGNAAQTDHSLGGVISGIDVTLDGTWRAGLAGGYSHSNFSSPSLAASGSIDSYHVALYGGAQFGAWGLRGGASYSWSDIGTSRQTAAVNLLGLQRGDYTANTTQVFGEVGHDFKFGNSALEPFANIAYVRVDGDVAETGSAAMTGSTKLDTTYTTLGLRGTTALTDALMVRGTLGWRHALGDITPVATLAFEPGGAAFSLAGSPIARDALVTEAGLDLAVAAHASVGVSWSGQFSEDTHSNAVSGHFTWRF